MQQPYISHKFKSAIWRLEIDTISETIFIEIRDQADKKVYFSAISLQNGNVFFDELQTEERWLTGIEAAYDGVLLLHNYQSEAGPAHKGIIAIDGFTGNTLWNNYVNAFDHLSINGPVIYDTRIQPRKLFLADIKSGLINRQFEPSIDIELDNHIILPDTISAEFLRAIKPPVAPFGNTIHYLEHNNFRIVSLHSLETGTLQQHLYIMDGMNIVYNDLLNSDIQKLQPESFLMHKDRLIYLKNKSQLKVLTL
ncbi:MAG: hypothetical protein JWP37_120 [Mucilaginibacter sp.]|nr:hypothetical protein [Mucilaginibacter sp.]